MSSDSKLPALCLKSKQEFEKSEYSKCVSSLSQLLTGSEASDKSSIEGNAALARLAHGGFANLKSYNHELTKLSTSKSTVICVNRAVTAFYFCQYKQSLNLCNKIINEQNSTGDAAEGPLINFDVDENIIYLAHRLRIEICLQLNDIAQADTFVKQAVSLKCVSADFAARAKYRMNCLKNTSTSTDNIKQISNKRFSSYVGVQQNMRADYDQRQNISALLSIDCGMSSAAVAVQQNNVGCIYAGTLSKTHLAASYFINAPNILISEVPEKDRLVRAPVMWRYAMQYNLGLSLLHSHDQPSAAFDCLLPLVQVFPRSARLWLRVAECSVQASMPQGNGKLFDLESRLKELTERMIGVGPHRRLVLQQPYSQCTVPSSSGAIPVACLDFASVCLRNALCMIPDTENMLDTDTVASPPGKPVNKLQILHMKCAVLCRTSYVHLCLGELQSTYAVAMQLCAIKQCPVVYRLLARNYASEALVSFGNAAGARQQLQHCQELLADDTKYTQSTPANDLWPLTPQQHRSAVVHNMAVTYALEGDTHRSLECSQMLNQPPMNIPADGLLSALFLHMHNGNDAVAQAVIGRFCQ